MKVIKRLLMITPLLLPFALISCSASKGSKYTAYIVSVHDGDTFNDSKGNTYRLSGVDTPEANNQYDGFKPTTGIEGIYARLATNKARELIEHQNVTIINEGDGRYGRIAAQIIINGLNLSVELVRNGLARVAYISSNPKSNYFNPDFTFYRNLLDAQYYAYHNKLGFWSQMDKFREIFPKAH